MARGVGGRGQFRFLQMGPGQLVPFHTSMVPPQSPEKGCKCFALSEGQEPCPHHHTSYSTPAHLQGREQLAKQQFAK